MRNFSKSMGLLWGFTIPLHQQSTQLDASSFISGAPSETGPVPFFFFCSGDKQVCAKCRGHLPDPFWLTRDQQSELGHFVEL